MREFGRRVAAKKRGVLSLILACALVLTGCTGDKTQNGQDTVKKTDYSIWC